MSSVYANGRSVIHKGHGSEHVAAPPDVCKTPGPGGPVPVPYPNIATDSDLAKGTKGVKIEGKSAANAGSNLSTSTGDEGGTAGGGLISAKTKGKMTWASSSPNVKLEGKGAVRFMDTTQHNGNSFNSAFTSMGGTGLAYADDFEGKCGICRKGPAAHRIMEKEESSGQLCQELLAALREEYAGGKVKGKEGKRWQRGFMVGVMVCKHNPSQSIATMSGNTMPAFARVAGRVVDHVVMGGKADLEEFINANQSTVSRSRVRRVLTAASRDVSKQQDNPAISRRYSPMGQCAGAKLVARSGHAPLNMTEMFFQAEAKPKWQWTATYSVLVNRIDPADAWLRSALDNAMSHRKDGHFNTGGSVPSCQTCQATLYLTMCPERTC